MRLNPLNQSAYFRQFLLLLTIFSCLLASSPVFSAEDDIRRRVAFKLFRATLAADTQIDNKRHNNKLIIALVYRGNSPSDRLRSESFVEQFKNNNKISDIHNNPVKIILISEQVFLNKTKSRETLANVAGIYILDELSKQSNDAIIQQTINKKIITYSPFKGDVENGILGGLSVEAKVRPYLNMDTLKRSGIHLKPFFLKVIKRYEP